MLGNKDRISPRGIIPESGALRREFEPLLKEWITLNEEFVNAKPRCREIPFWFDEETDVGLLSAAAWRIGGLSLVETKNMAKRKKVHAGITDAYIRMPHNTHIWLIEAKKAHVDLEKEKNAKINKKIKEAIDNARNYNEKECKYGGYKLFAIVFIAPHMRAKAPRREAELKKLFDLMETKVKENPKSCVAAWYFPEELRAQKIGWDKKYHPGVAVLIFDMSKI